MSEYMESRGWDSEEPVLVEMYHPELDDTVKVPEKSVHVLYDSGWRRTDGEEPDTAEEPTAGDEAPEFREPAEQEDTKE